MEEKICKYCGKKLGEIHHSKEDCNREANVRALVRVHQQEERERILKIIDSKFPTTDVDYRKLLNKKEIVFEIEQLKKQIKGDDKHGK